MKKTFVMADPHGAYEAIVQCLNRSEFNKGVDELIVLGDVCDGWHETKRCIDLLLEIEATYIIGNHDEWTLDWMETGNAPRIWTQQGGIYTIKSYMPEVSEFFHGDYVKPEGIPQSHIDYLRNAYLFLEDEINGKKCLFVHGGFDFFRGIENTSRNEMMWNRDLMARALQNEVIARKSNTKPKDFPFYDEIFIGHTTTETLGRKCEQVGLDGSKPVKACNVWLLDQGAGWSGYLSIMNIETKEFYMSDKVSTLYPDVKGRE